MSPEKTNFILFRRLRTTELCEALAHHLTHLDFFDSLGWRLIDAQPQSVEKVQHKLGFFVHKR